MYRISWKSDTRSGHGKFILTVEWAFYWLKRLNREYPDIEHWIEAEQTFANNGNYEFQATAPELSCEEDSDSIPEVSCEEDPR